MMDAFGFFDTEQEHEAVLREAARILMTGGRLVLKVINGGPILDAFRETDREERDGVVVSVSSTLTIDPPRMTQRISVSDLVARQSTSDVSVYTESRSCVPHSNTPGSLSWAFWQVRTVPDLNRRGQRQCGSWVGDAIPRDIGLPSRRDPDFAAETQLLSLPRR
jgi:hypothetical protein